IVLARYRKTRRPISLNAATAQVFERALGSAHIVAECIGRERRHTLMTPTMRRDLVTRGRDSANHIRVLLRQPTEHEECARDAVRGEQRQEALNTCGGARGNPAPVRPRDYR